MSHWHLIRYSLESIERGSVFLPSLSPVLMLRLKTIVGGWWNGETRPCFVIIIFFFFFCHFHCRFNLDLGEVKRDKEMDQASFFNFHSVSAVIVANH